MEKLIWLLYLAAQTVCGAVGLSMLAGGVFLFCQAGAFWSLSCLSGAVLILLGGGVLTLLVVPLVRKRK